MAFVYSFVLEPCFEPYCVDSSATLNRFLMSHVVPVVYSQMLHWNRVIGLAFVLNG